MSQTTNEIWTRCLQAPVSVWESQSGWEPKPDEWPELVTDRLTLAESNEADWKTIEYVAIAYQAGVVFTQLKFDFDIEEKFKRLTDQVSFFAVQDIYAPCISKDHWDGRACITSDIA
jgi:hypothetical protein